MADRTVLYQLIEARLDGTLAEYIETNKPTMSWRKMAADLSTRAGVTINHETLRLWFADRISIEVKVSTQAGAA